MKLILILSIFLLLIGCNGPTLGPTVRTDYLILSPGTPLQILSNTKVTGRALSSSGGTVDQDISGWIAMPPDHWEVVKKKLQEASKP